MLKLVLLCVLGLAVGQEDGDTRHFGLGLGGGVHGGLGGGVGGLHGGGGGGVHGGLHGGGGGGVHGGVGGGVHGGVGGGVHGGVQGQSATCRYWCKTPHGQSYCCESGAKPPGPVGTKSGKCPTARLECPPVRSFFSPPKTCSNDYSCSGSDKCCYDVCLREHVCKPAEFYPIPLSGR